MAKHKKKLHNRNRQTNETVRDEDLTGKNHDDYALVTDKNDADEYDRGYGLGWLPLLLIPLFLLGAFLLWPRPTSNSNSSQTAYVQPTPPSNTTGPAFGVGGGPAITSVSPTTVQNTAYQTVTPTAGQGARVGVGGGPGNLAQSGQTTGTPDNTNSGTMTTQNTNSVPSTSPRTGRAAY